MPHSKPKLPQRVVSIVGREVEQRIVSEGSIERILEVPPQFDSVSIGSDKQSLVVHAVKPVRGTILLRIAGEGEPPEGRVLAIRFANFAPREFFVIPVMSCNYHTGWNPQLMVRLPHRETCASGLSGNPFANIPLFAERLRLLGRA
jgi:hypothetical protein